MGATRHVKSAGLFTTAKSQEQDPYLLLIGAVLAQAVRDARGSKSRGWSASVQQEALAFLQDAMRLDLWVGMVNADVDDIQAILLAVSGREGP